MTNPRNLTQFGTWSVPNCLLAIEYDLEILEAIRHEVTKGLQAPRGGLEIGGLLLGTYDGERVRITGFETVERDASTGPTFFLNESDTNALTAQIQSHEKNPRDQQIVVGWYQSHIRRGLTLSTSDVRIYDQHFSKPWQVALLLRPDPAGGVHARFFLREPASPVKRRPGVAAAGAAATGTQGARRPRSSTPDATVSPSAPVPIHVEAPSATASAHEESSPAAAEIRRVIQRKAVWTALATVAVLAMLSVFYMRFHFTLVPRSPGVLPLEAAARNGGLELRWDPKALGNAAEGKLEVRDGSELRQIALDRAALASGRFSYRQTSDVVGFRLRADRDSGPPVEGSAMYIAGNQVARSIPAADPAPRLPAPTAPVSEAPSVQAVSVPPGAEPARTEVAKARPETNPTAAAPPVSAPATRSVEQPSKALLSPTPAAHQQDDPPKQKAELPPAPAVETAQVQRPAVPEPTPLPALTVPRVDPPPAAPPPARTPTKESVTLPSPAPQQPALRLAGRWTLQSGGYSRSPAVPESVSIAVSETNGSVQGRLEARYRARSTTVRIHFSFSGQIVNGVARFAWTSSEGKRGQIEFIRVPNSPDLAEVVWQNPESNNVYDEMLRRAN